MSNGEYFVTKFRPVIEEVATTGKYEPYAEPGDPIGVRMCSYFVHNVLNVPELKHLQSHKVKFSGLPFGNILNYDRRTTKSTNIGSDHVRAS